MSQGKLLIRACNSLDSESEQIIVFAYHESRVNGARIQVFSKMTCWLHVHCGPSPIKEANISAQPTLLLEFRKGVSTSFSHAG